MKHAISCYLLLLFVFACKKQESLDPYSYDRPYPRNKDGSQIKTYTPQIKGGELEAVFNGQPWNHAPYVILRAPITVLHQTGEKFISISISPAKTYGTGKWETCKTEGLSFRIPLPPNMVLPNKYSKTTKITTAGFVVMDCDAIYSEYELDKSKLNWATLRNYDSESKVIETEFAVSFTIDFRARYSLIYPEHVTVRGKAKINI